MYRMTGHHLRYKTSDNRVSRECGGGKVRKCFFVPGFWCGLGVLMGVWIWDWVYLEMETVCSVRLGGWANRR